MTARDSHDSGTTMPLAQADSAPWPPLPLAEWQATYDTLHLWTQIVGKTRLALAPMQNHWWHAVLYLTSRGLGTSPMPCEPRGTRALELEFDFADQVLVARTTDGVIRTIPLVPQPLADFYRGYLAMLDSLSIPVAIYPKPVEMDNPIPFAEDRVHEQYDRESARRCWRVLLQADRVLKAFRGRFLGKCSPVHFWWGSFDLACTRFSGRTAPPHPGGVPHLADFVTREAYSHECISAGWWPGGGALPEPAFYTYAYPEPPGCASAAVRPASAYWEGSLREWVLPYEAVRTAADPDAALLDFLQSTYEAAAELGRWDRASLDRPEQEWPSPSGGRARRRSTSWIGSRR